MSASAHDAPHETVRPARLTWRTPLVLGCLFAALVAYFVAHPEGRFRSGRAHGDGTYYYVYLRSLFFDHDLDFTNDYALLGNQFHMGHGPGKRPANPFTIGPALFWAPFFAAAHGLAVLGNHLGWLHDPLDGSSTLYHRVTFFGSLFWGFCAIVLALLLLRHFFDEHLALLGSLALAVATPLSWYITRQPCFSHAVDAFAVAAFVYYWHSSCSSRALRGWLILGLLGGLAMLVRPQNVGYLLLPLGEGLLLVIRSWRRREWREVGRLVGQGCACVAAVNVGFLPQMLAWALLYGRLHTIPQGEGFLLLAHSKWVETLLSSRNGLFAWHPLMYGALLGLCLFPFRAALPPRARLLALLGLLALAFQVFINGSVSDWWAGWSFGGRRYSSAAILFALGFASLFWAMRVALRRVGPFLLAATPAALLGLFAVCNLSLMDDYVQGRVRYAASQDLSTIYKRAAEKVIGLSWTAIGNPGSVPANWMFAARARVSPARFDELSGAEILDGRDVEGISFASSRLLTSGFGDPLTYRGVRARRLEEPTGILVFSLRKAEELRGTIRLCPARDGTTVSLVVNNAVALETPLEPGWHSYPFRLPASQLVAGLNYASLWQRLPADPRAQRHAIGTTGSSMPAELTARSAGYGSGNLARFYLGRELYTRGERGLQLVLVDPDGRGLRFLGVFDSFTDPSAADRFARTVHDLPRGAIVALAVKDEASKHWTPKGDHALRSLGGNTSLLGRYRSSYAMIGVKGADPGQAVEQLHASRSVSVDVGRPLDQRANGVACATLELARPLRPRPPKPRTPAR